MSFWCFVCFSSLFNLQGTSRSLSQQLCYCITSVILCQALFQVFWTFVPNSPHANLFSLSRSQAFVKTFFRIFSESTGFIRFDLALSQALSYYTKPYPICQHLFSSFFDFFIPSFHIAFLICVYHSSIHYIMYVLYLHKPFSQLLISTKHWLRKQCIIIQSSYSSHYRLKDLCVT